MTDEDLIAVLKDWPYMGETYAKIAADRIEQLVKEVEAAQHEADEADLYAWNLENKLAKTVEALRKLVKLDDDYSPFGGELLRDRVVRTWEEARIALAELDKTE